LLNSFKIYAVYLLFLPFFLLRKCNTKLTIKTILVIRLDRFGDMVLTFPYLVALRKKYPYAIISVLCSNKGASFLRAQNSVYSRKLVDEIIVWNNVWDMHRGFVLGLSNLFSLAKQVLFLRAKKYDVIIQPVQVGTWTLLSLLLKCNCVIATIDNSLPLSKLLAKRVDLPIYIDNVQKNHATFQLDHCFNKLDIYNVNSSVLKFSMIDVSDCIKLLPLKKTIIVNVSAGDPVRMLPIKVTISLINKLLEKFTDYNIVLIGMSNDNSYAKKICLLTHHPIIDIVGQTSINDLAYIFNHSELLLTSDTGTMHLAAMANIHIVAYFTAGSLIRFRPVTDNCTIIQHELGCSGCGDMCFTDEMPKPCMAAITADELFDAVSSVLDKRGDNVED